MKIFLTGFMGCGKSYWGKIWADALHIPFIELDELIEQEAGSTIANIFVEKGEDHFRELESTILKRHTGAGDWIMSTGGGTPCFFNNMQWMNDHGRTIYIEAMPQLLAKRLLHERDKRPVIKNIPGEELEIFITEKLNEREAFYRQAAITLNPEQLNANSILNL